MEFLVFEQNKKRLECTEDSSVCKTERTTAEIMNYKTYFQAFQINVKDKRLTLMPFRDIQVKMCKFRGTYTKRKIYNLIKERKQTRMQVGISTRG